MLEIKKSLRDVLKRVRLSGIVPTLPDQIAYAKKAKLSQQDFLELLLQDELERRQNKKINCNLKRSGLEDFVTLEDYNWDTDIAFDRELVRELFNLSFIERQEDVLFLGQVGVGKSMLASALGHAACRANYKVLFFRAEKLLLELHQCRADNSQEKAIRKLLNADLLIIDDFGLRRLDSEQSSDFYEIIVERHRRSSTIITSNRDVEEWIPLFDDPLLAQSAIDRVSNNAHKIIMEGESYRKRLGPNARKKASKKTKRSKRTRRKRLK